jgi:pimeloyl-ACP methyl ester carboxylesterase
MNVFPSDFDHTLTGFGGDPDMDQAQHRASKKKTPVILIHGNAANVAHPKFGWFDMRRFLKDEGYQDCEIWAMDYLGENRDLPPEMPTPVKNHIDDLRKFIDDVIAYLNVERIDIICHSLGGMMTCAYMRGYKSDGTFDNEIHRLDKVGTAVFLACANHGLGQFSPGEFQTGGDFEVNCHKFDGVTDFTPVGASDPKKMVAPVDRWKVATKLDVDKLPPQTMYVAIIAANDFVDQQNKDTSRLEGADKNERFNLGFSIIGHEKILKDRGVFNAFRDYLNVYPPGIPATVLAVSPVFISVDKDSGSYTKPLSITVDVTPTDTVVTYAAKHVTKEYQAGYIVEKAVETLNDNLKNGEALTLSTDGIWEVTFSCPGASDVKRVYGVSVAKPIVEIMTLSAPRFTDSREVQAVTSNGKLYYSLDGVHFNEGSKVKIPETYTVYFISIDKGNASEIVYRFYEKEAE